MKYGVKPSLISVKLKNSKPKVLHGDLDNLKYLKRPS